MNNDIFESEEEKAEARKSLPELLQFSGWKLIVKALDANIEYFTDQLKNRIENKRDFENLEQLYALQDRIDDLERMKDLPQTLLQAAQTEPEEEDDSIY
jgi:hypothetical protein